jgi:hypothetical protein
MIDVKKIKYDAILLTAEGRKLRITELLQSLTWEENQSELAQRASMVFRNIPYAGTYLCGLAKLGAQLYIFSDWGAGMQEVFRGTIWDWDYKSSAKKDLTLIVYDNLVYMQKSKDNKLYSAGTSSKTIILDIFETWGIPINTYQGPDVALGKKVFRNRYISDMIFETLDDAKKRGAGRFVVRGVKGNVQILPRGSNQSVYHFGADSNTIMTGDKLSMDDLITRVKIIGKEDSEGRAPVEAVLDGKTEFGILQEIYHRDQEDSLAAAKQAAQEILNERGTPKRTTSLQAPDLPFIRKGDKIHVAAGNLTGYFYIAGVQHDATNGKMLMEVEAA